MMIRRCAGGDSENESWFYEKKALENRRENLPFITVSETGEDTSFPR